MIIGAAVGALLLLLCAYCYWRRRRRVRHYGVHLPAGFASTHGELRERLAACLAVQYDNQKGEDGRCVWCQGGWVGGRGRSGNGNSRGRGVLKPLEAPSACAELVAIGRLPRRFIKHSVPRVLGVYRVAQRDILEQYDKWHAIQLRVQAKRVVTLVPQPWENEFGKLVWDVNERIPLREDLPIDKSVQFVVKFEKQEWQQGKAVVVSDRNAIGRAWHRVSAFSAERGDAQPGAGKHCTRY